MTKVTAEMLERIDGFGALADDSVVLYRLGHLRALISLSRRVIEPGEEEIERLADVARGAWVLTSGSYWEDRLHAVARAVLAAISTGDAD